MVEQTTYEENHNGELGNFMFTVGSLTNAFLPALALFWYRGDAAFYQDIILWKISDKIMLWSRLILWGLAFTTQFLSLFGVHPDLNIATWVIFIGIVSPVFDLIYIAL